MHAINVGEIEIVEEMAMVKGQTRFKFRTWGGKRRGAGRPAKGVRPSEPHKTRRSFRMNDPVHVTLRVAADVSSLRKHDKFLALRAGTLALARRADSCRIVHMSIQSTHVHLIVEASDQYALARGIQSFAGSAAKRLNRALSIGGVRRRGAVFPDRYHARILKSPTSVRHAMSYVLNNWRHHGEDRTRDLCDRLFDPFSSAHAFTGWRELAGTPLAAAPHLALAVSPPRSWLLREGWKRAGPISALEIPAR